MKPKLIYRKDELNEKEQKKTSRKRRILVVALLIAALIVSGSTFAWFTSKDEVTNRLSASADYGVSMRRTTPPQLRSTGRGRSTF